MILRSRKALVLLVATLGVAGSLLGAVMTNVILLGPTSVALPADALTVRASWFRLPDLDPEHDYYSIVVSVFNSADAPDVYPYAIVVNLTVTGGQPVDHRPMAGDRRVPGEDSLSWGGSPPDLHLNLPAGFVTPHEGASYQEWSVAGQRRLESQPVFASEADFYAQFILPENATLDAQPAVSLTWFYTNPLQAYPVATQAQGALCYYVPDATAEGNAPYSSCG